METARLAEHLQSLPRRRSSLLPALLEAQRIDGFVSDDALVSIARHVRLATAEAEGVLSAYPELRRRPPMRPLLRVCTGESCRCAGAESVLAAARQAEQDGACEVEEVHCFFLCGVGPVVELDGERHGRATPLVLDALRQPESRS